MPLPRDPYLPHATAPITESVTITKKADAVSDARSYFFRLPNGDVVEVRIRAAGATARFESHVRGFAQACQELSGAAITTERIALSVVA